MSDSESMANFSISSDSRSFNEELYFSDDDILSEVGYSSSEYNDSGMYNPRGWMSIPDELLDDDDSNETIYYSDTVNVNTSFQEHILQGVFEDNDNEVSTVSVEDGFTGSPDISDNEDSTVSVDDRFTESPDIVEIYQNVISAENRYTSNLQSEIGSADDAEVPPVIGLDNISANEASLDHDNSDLSAVPGPSKDVPRSPVISKRKEVKQESDEGVQTCSICFEPYGNSGNHRIASLKCGHLFGKHCIERWLAAGTARCPQCNARASNNDIRVLYTKSILVFDTTEKDKLVEELTKIKSEKRSLQKKFAKDVMNHQINSQLVLKLQEELRLLKQSLESNCDKTTNNSGSVQNTLKFSLHKTFDLSGSCRVLCYNEWLNMLLISASTNVDMFRGFGVKKINMFEMKIDKYIPIHRKQIKDLSFCSLNKELVLSVAMDFSVKITNMCSNNAVYQHKLNSCAFSCCWKYQSATEFFVGTGHGKVLHYNTNIENPLDTIEMAGSGPVVALIYISNIPPFYTEGLLIVRLDSVWLLNFGNDTKREQKIDVVGPFIGAHFDPGTNHLLINCRPSSVHPHARHILYNLVPAELDGSPGMALREMNVFLGSATIKLLSRSSVVASMRGNTYVIINEESTNYAKIYDASTFQLVHKIKFPVNILECVPARVMNENYVIFLTASKAHVYRLIEE